MKAKLTKEEAEKVATALENAPEPTTTVESPAKPLTEARSSEKKEEDYVKHAECCIIS